MRPLELELGAALRSDRELAAAGLGGARSVTFGSVSTLGDRYERPLDVGEGAADGAEVRSD
jgi:hypothetical protein